MLSELVETLDSPHFALWGPFIILILCGFGFPMPEDIVLVTAGFLAGKHSAPIYPVIIVTYIGIMVGDSIIFMLGYRFGPTFLDTKIGRWALSESTLVKARKAFYKYGIWVNFFGRFLPGVRTAIFFTGGTLKYNFWKFFTMDGLAALISGPVFVGLGYWAGFKFNENMDLIEKYVGKTKLYMSIAVFLLALCLVLYFIWIRKKNAQNDEKETSSN